MNCDRITAARITEFIDAATENYAANVTDALMEHEKEHFADYDAFTDLRRTSENCVTSRRRNCMGFEINDGILIRYTEEPGTEDVIIPDCVTVIGEAAFWNCKTLKTVTVPDGVKSIGIGAFEKCGNLQKISIPDSVTEIGKCAFMDCRNLKEITLPGGLISIGDNAFGNCSSLTGIVIPNGVTDIGNEAFEGCTGLTDITIPESVISAGEDVLPIYGSLRNCFYRPDLLTIPRARFSLADIAAMTWLRNPDRLAARSDRADIEKYIVSRRKELLRRIFEEDLVSAILLFDDYGELKAGELEKIYLQPASEANAVQCIAYLLDWQNRNDSSENAEARMAEELYKDTYNAADMQGLWKWKDREDGTVELTAYLGEDTDIAVPPRIGEKTVTVIGRECFMYRYQITKSVPTIRSIVLTEGIQEIGDSAFENCDQLADLQIPDSVTSIGSRAFYECSSLTDITIPNGVTDIGEMTFYKCRNLTSITLPDSVKTIGERAFCFCRSLNSITIPESVTSIGRSAFVNCFSGLRVHAPKGSYAAEYAGEHGISCSEIT